MCPQTRTPARGSTLTGGYREHEQDQHGEERPSNADSKGFTRSDAR